VALSPLIITHTSYFYPLPPRLANTSVFLSSPFPPLFRIRSHRPSYSPFLCAPSYMTRTYFRVQFLSNVGMLIFPFSRFCAEVTVALLSPVLPQQFAEPPHKPSITMAFRTSVSPLSPPPLHLPLLMLLPFPPLPLTSLSLFTHFFLPLPPSTTINGNPSIGQLLLIAFFHMKNGVSSSNFSSRLAQRFASISPLFFLPSTHQPPSPLQLLSSKKSKDDKTTTLTPSFQKSTGLIFYTILFFPSRSGF